MTLASPAGRPAAAVAMDGGGTARRAPSSRPRAAAVRVALAGVVALAGLAAADPPPVARAQTAAAAATPGDAAGVVAEALGLHVVRPGETMWRLAADYGMRAADLAALNGVRPTALLLPGRALRVPVARAANARAGAPAGSSADGTARTLQGDLGGADGGGGEAAATPYEVALGDTLYAIADRFGVDIEAIKRRNGLPADGSIWEGQTLLIPTAGAAARAATPGGAPAAPAPAAAKTASITVAAGDTLSSIAARHGTTAAALMRLNGLESDAIAAGQVLVVPRAGSGVLAGRGAKRIEVDIGDQRMYVWEGDDLVFNWTASTGLATHPTRTGAFAVQSKEPNAWSSAWQLWMPHWLGIYWAGGSENGIHALPVINGTTLWGGMLGSPVSYGCVVLDTADAETLYNWADIGTPVDIHD